MKRIFVFALLLLMPLALHAEVLGRKFGAGIVIGGPTGVTGKYWLDSRNAIDGVVTSYHNDLYLHFDYLWHDYRAFPRPEEGKLPLYFGAGASVATGGDLGLRGVIGVEYIFADYPFDLFLELAPVLTVTGSTGFGFMGGLGGRYYFGTGGTR